MTRPPRLASKGAAPPLEPEFWKRKTLEELNPDEWEALCDGCGKCCLIKLEDEETGRLHQTRVACRLFDEDLCRCGAYDRRAELVPQCMVLTPEVVRRSLDWIPRTCAYRLVAEGYDLYSWHPLVSGDPESVHRAGVSVRGAVVPEWEVADDEMFDHVVEDML